MWGMRATFLLIVAVVLAGCASNLSDGSSKEANKKSSAEQNQQQSSKVKVVSNSLKAKMALEVTLKKAIGQLGGVDPVITEAHMSRLKYVDLRSKELTDISVLRGLTQVNYLFLQGNNLTDVSVLTELKKLEQLDLTNNPNLTKAEIAKLRKALPKCNIIHNAKK